VVNLVNDVSCLHNTLDVLLSWKQQSAFDYFSKTNTETGFAKSRTALLMTEVRGRTCCYCKTLNACLSFVS